MRAGGWWLAREWRWTWEGSKKERAAAEEEREEGIVGDEGGAVATVEKVGGALQGGWRNIWTVGWRRRGGGRWRRLVG